MRKKIWLGAAIAAAAVCTATAVGAESRAFVEQSILIEIPDSYDAYYYAKLVNQSEEPIVLYEGIFTALDENGEELFVSDSTIPSPFLIRLEPGAYTYVRGNVGDDILVEKDIVDYGFEMTEYENPEFGESVSRHDGELELELSEDPAFDSTITLTLTNDTESIPYDWYTYAVLFDEDDNLIYVSDCYYVAGIHPGSKVSWKFDIDSEIVEYWKEHGITPAKGEGFAYTPKLDVEEPAPEETVSEAESQTESVTPTPTPTPTAAPTTTPAQNRTESIGDEWKNNDDWTSDMNPDKNNNSGDEEDWEADDWENDSWPEEF